MMTQEQYKKHADIFINTTFVMTDSIDIMIRQAIDINERYGETLSREFKQTHNQLMSYLRMAKTTLDKFNKFCDDTLSWQDRDTMRTESNELCRLILLYADRTYQDEDKSKMIEDYIKFMPEKGQLNTEYIEKYFTLK